ncbi:MAG: ribose-phosphate pyrophosphokinase [uncultured archaeon A07HB70]|nr:MAG: ribose-phosphate pyrophosphokinase [uncultured archaeon A07HB70]
MIVPGPPSQSLAAELAAATDRPLAEVSYDRFPDGEALAAAPGFAGDEAVVVCSTPGDAAHLQLLQLQDAVREAGAERVTTVIPYMGYARQDEAFEAGHPVSARAVARAVSTGADRVVLVSPHEPAVADFFDVPVAVVDAASLLAGALPDLVEPLFLAPDEGAVGLATAVRDAYGRGETDHFEKTRHSGSEVTVRPHDTAATGRGVVVVDDIVATGSTMSAAIAGLDGPARTLVACVHPVLSGVARTRLAQADVDAVHATDTLERPCSTVSAAPAVADALE